MPKEIAPAILQGMLDSVPKTESGAIDLTKAVRIAEGGTHVLYRFPDAPFVIKLMKANPNPEELDELERKYAVLYDCFDQDGKQRCIRERHITHQVQLPGKEPQNASLSIVPYEKCFKSKVKFDFKMEPAELDPYLMDNNSELCDRVNKALINKDPTADFDLDYYAVIDPRIGDILTRLDDDPELRAIMIEFLDHYRDFYQKTNIILDAMGFENILFFKDESGDWQFKVGSAIKHDTGKYTTELFDELHEGKEVDLNKFYNFTHAYFSPANIRAVNVCAMKLGLDPVIHDVRIDPTVLLRISQELSVGERMLAYARHGDFEKMDRILQEHRGELSFNLRDFWAYSQIADEYIKHGQPPLALKNYLDTVSELPVILPENEDDAKRVQDLKTDMIDRKNMHDKKIILHQELTTVVPRVSHHSDKKHTVAVSEEHHEEIPEATHTHTDRATIQATEPHGSAGITTRYKDRAQEIRKSEPGYMAPTESSQAKEREKYTPFSTTSKPPWKP